MIGHLSLPPASDQAPAPPAYPVSVHDHGLCSFLMFSPLKRHTN